MIMYVFALRYCTRTSKIPCQVWLISEHFLFCFRKMVHDIKKKKQAKRPQNDVVFWYLFNILKKIIVY